MLRSNHGWLPVNISITVHPKLHMSTFALYFVPFTTSGAIQNTVPLITELFECGSYALSCPLNFDNPKSVILQVPF